MAGNYQDKHYDLSFTITLTPNQELKNIGIQLDKDADFIWESLAVQYQGNGGNPGLPFGVQFIDATKYELSDGYVGNFAFAAATGLGVPYVLASPLFFPAGSAIIMNIINQIGTGNGPIQFLFTGRKRFYN